jgi:hypothetical protein
MNNIEKFENDSREIALDDYYSQKKFNDVIRSFISELDYRTTRIFLRIFMSIGTDKNKTMFFYSKPIRDFFRKNEARLRFDIFNEEEYKLEEIFEDDSRIFFIDSYNFKKETKQPFRTELICSKSKTDYLKLNKKIIFYDIDHKWKEIKNKEDNLILDNYDGWIPENFQEKLIYLALSN